MSQNLSWTVSLDPAVAVRAMRELAQEHKKTSASVGQDAKAMQREIAAAWTQRDSQERAMLRTSEAAWKRHESEKLTATKTAEKQGEGAVAASNQAKERLAQRTVAVRRQQEADLAANIKRFERERLQIATQNSRAIGALAKVEADVRIRESRRAHASLIAALRDQAREVQRLAQQQRAAIVGTGGSGAFLAGAAGGLSALIGVSAISEIRQAGAAWLDYSSKLETTKIAFTTMLGSAQLAEQHLKELQQFALKTPFQFGELIDASQRMQALGFSAQQIVPILTDVGNAVAAAGGGSERLDRVVLALSQIQSKGKVATQEMNQLAESGISGWKILEQQLGKSRAELVKLVEAGEISSKTFLDAFQKFSQQNFGGLMEAQSKTFSGAMSNIKDALLQTSQTAFAPLYERISEIARELAKTSTSSKELQQNMEAAGKGIIQVWDGVVTVFYVVRDVIGLVAAFAISIIGLWTHAILALYNAIRALYLNLKAVAQIAAGDFFGGMNSARMATEAAQLASSELTDALKSQGAVAQQVARIYEEAEFRKAAASISAAQKIAAAQLGSTYSGPQRVGGSLTLSGGLQPGAATGAPSGSGKGKSKKSKVDNTARDAFRAETQATNDAITERQNAYRDETSQLKGQYDQRLIDFSSHIAALIKANKGRFDATSALIKKEQEDLEIAHARKLIKDDEYTKRASELQKIAAKAVTDFNVEAEKLETESYQHRLQLQQQFDAQRGELRDQKTADEISDLTRLRDIAIEDAALAIDNETQRAKAILQIEIEYNDKVKTLRLQQLERSKEAIYAEIRLIAERLAEVQKISIAEAMASKVVQDALAERAVEIETIENKRTLIIKEASDANIDAYRKEASAAKGAWEAAAKEAAGKAAKAGGWQQGEDQDAFDQFRKSAEGALSGQSLELALFGIEAMRSSFEMLGNAVGQAVQSFVLFGKVEGGFRKFAAELIASIAAMAAVQAVYQAAQGLAWLALNYFFPNPAYYKAAMTAFASAAVFGGIAGVAAIAGRAVAGNKFADSGSGSSTAGNAFKSASGAGTQAEKPTTTDVNRRAIAQPQVVVLQPIVHLHGDIATPALNTRVVDAVVQSLDLNDDRLTGKIQDAAKRGR